jgi:RHS repeat-associated protein
MYYSGLNGRLSQKTSAFGNTVVASVSETWSYNSLGLIATHGHPAIGSPDTVANYSYLLGYPTSLGVGGTCASGALCLVTSATYNPSGGLSSWTAGNGIVTTIVQDLNSMPRPSRIYSAGLDTGTYSYDGAGNITAIGSNAYGYDKRSRVLSGQGETYGYDRFGNLMKVDGATIAIAPQTNRLTTGYSYDALGNVLTSPTAVYTYDGLSRQKAYTAASVAETYLYDGANERIARINPATNTSDDTRVLAVSAPASMNAGATATVTVTMLNTGTTTWTLAAGFQLGAYDPQDNTRFGFNRVSLGSGDSIAPGQQKTFSFTITAPVIPGDYGSQWRMVHNGVAWFGEPSGEKMISVNSTTATYTLAKFYTIVPCRVLDTRQPTGPYGGPALSGGTPRVLDVRGGATTNCSVTIPPSVAVVGNLTAINPLTSGSISIAPDGTEFPTDTSFFPGAKVRATNFITGLAGGKVDLLYEGGLTANVTLDVSGYFKNPASPPPSAPLAVSQRLKPSFPDSPTGTVPPNHLPDAATLAASRSPQAITSGFWNLTFREDQNRLSSEYFAFPSSSTRLRDYFYFGNLLVSTRDTSGSYLFYAADHLGTPRVVTDGYGVIEDAHTYLPYGKEVTTPATSTALSFASMERDSRSGNDFDHARYSLTTMGRFLGVDKVGGHPSNPQTWNRYAYARNNPLKFNDPNGLETNPVTGGSGIADSDIRTTATNPNIGRFGDTRFDGDGDPKFHGGDDLVAEAGTPLHAPVGGTAQVFTTKEGGLIVAIVTTRDGQSIRESIAHLSSASVKTGEKVSEGQIVARSGSTGNAKGLTGSQQHTHLSVRVNGELVDPQPYFGAHPSQATPPLPQSGCGSVGFVGPCQTMQSTTEGGPPTV